MAKRRLVTALAEPKPWSDPRYFFGGPTQEQAKRIAWDDLEAMVKQAGIWAGSAVSRLRIDTVFGSQLWIFGLDEPARIEGQAWDGCILDESCDLRPGVFVRSVRPSLADRIGWCWRIGVPKRTGPGAPEYRAFCESCETGRYPGGAHFSWPSADILDPDEIKHARQTLDPRDFREQFEACWETASGQIFYSFNREYNVRPCAYDPKKALIIGSDFNVDPLCWVIGHKYKDHIEWIDELFLRNANTQAGLNALWSRYSSHEGGFEFYGDATGQSRKTSSSVTDYLLIANDARFKARRTIHYPPSNPAVADRFAACNSLFENAAGDRRMFVAPNCRALIRDLEVRAYKPGTREPADSGDVGHITDAMGYAVHRLFPVMLDLGGVKQSIITRPYAQRVPMVMR